MQTLAQAELKPVHFGNSAAVGLYEPSALIIDPHHEWREKYSRLLNIACFDMLARYEGVLGKGGFAERWKYKTCFIDPEVFPNTTALQTFLAAYREQQCHTRLVALVDQKGCINLEKLNVSHFDRICDKNILSGIAAMA